MSYDLPNIKEYVIMAELPELVTDSAADLILNSAIEMIGDEDESLMNNTLNEETGILLNTLIQLKGDCFFNLFIGRFC